LFATITVFEFTARSRLFYFADRPELDLLNRHVGLSFNPFHLEPAMAIVLGPGLLGTLAGVIIAVRLWRDDVARFGRPPGRAKQPLPEKVG